LISSSVELLDRAARASCADAANGASNATAASTAMASLLNPNMSLSFAWLTWFIL
jgi:hypothetical protein